MVPQTGGSACCPQSLSIWGVSFFLLEWQDEEGRYRLKLLLGVGSCRPGGGHWKFLRQLHNIWIRNPLPRAWFVLYICILVYFDF